jgi:hypothetical protein
MKYLKQDFIQNQKTSRPLLSRKKVEEIRMIINNLCIVLNRTKSSRKMDEFFREVKILRIFSLQGKYGIVGLCKIIKADEFSVFKLSTDINRIIEHEQGIINDLEQLNIPNVVKNFGKISLPISSKFISHPTAETFKISESLIPRDIIFLEFVNKTPLYKLCDKTFMKQESGNNLNNNIILSQVYQTILTLQILHKKKFTHYDLHTGNILIQKCSPDSVFLYKIDGECFFVPSFGFFPLLIDFGNSYSSTCENRSFLTNMTETKFGIHSSFFDRAMDIQHFLINLFYYLENRNYQFNIISQKMKYFFRHFPLQRKSGWMVLPYDISAEIISQIKSECPRNEKYNILNTDTMKRNFIDKINYLIRLPLKQEDDSFNPCYYQMMDEFEKLFDIRVMTSDEIIYSIGIVSSIIFECESCENKYVVFENKLKQALFVDIEKIFDYSIINFKSLFDSILSFSRILGSRYCSLINIHERYLKNIQFKSPIKSPIDIFNYLEKNFSLRYDISNKSTIYFIDSDKNDYYSCSELDVTDQEIEQVNSASCSEKGNVLFKLLDNGAV